MYAYDFVAAAWDQLSDSTTRMNNANADQNYEYVLLPEHQESDGTVRIRFLGSSTNSAHRLYLDRVVIDGTASGPSAADIAEAVWVHDISAHEDHTSAGFYVSRSVIDHGDVVSVASAVVTVSGISTTADLYNGLSVEFHDETNDVYEIRRITDMAINGANTDLTLDRAPVSTLTSDWDAYILGAGMSITPAQVNAEADTAISDASLPTSAQVVAAILAETGITAGGVVSVQDIIKAVYAAARGKVAISGSAYAYKDDDDSTTLYTLTPSSTGRTTA